MASSTLTVTCGSLSGTLHMNRFLCPGIHQECIQMSEGQFVTPKMFSVLGDKERLKDWKNAIRINGISVRKLMDAGDLEFYNHLENCTGRCISRLTGISKYDSNVPTTVKEDPDWSPAAVMQNSKQPLSGATQHAYSVLMQKLPQTAGSQLQQLQQPVYPTATIKNIHSVMGNSNAASTVTNNITGETVVIKQEKPDAYEDAGSGVSASMAGATIDYSLDSDIEDPETFWLYIVELGLLNDFFREIKTTLDVLKHDIIRDHCKPVDSQRLTNVVNALGLMTKLKWKLSAHKTDTERQNQMLMKEMEDLKKRVAAAENRQKALKRKSQAFDQLMEISRAKKTATAGLLTPSPSSTPPPPSIPVAVKSTGGAPHRVKAAQLAGQTNPVVNLSKGNPTPQTAKRTPVASKDSNGVKNTNPILSVKLPRQVGKKKSSNVPSSSESMDESYDEEEEDEDEEEEEEEEEEDEDMSEDEEEEIVYDPNDPDWGAEQRKRRRKSTPSTSARKEKAVKMVVVSAKDPKVTSTDLVITTRAAKKALITEISPTKPGESPVSDADGSAVVKPLRLSAIKDNSSDNVVYKLSASHQSDEAELTKEDTDCKTEVAVSSTEPSGGKDGSSTESKSSPQDKESKVSTEGHTKVTSGPTEATSGQTEVTSGQTEVTSASKTGDNEISKPNVSSKMPSVDGKKRELIITTRAKKRALSGSQEK